MLGVAIICCYLPNSFANHTSDFGQLETVKMETDMKMENRNGQIVLCVYPPHFVVTT